MAAALRFGVVLAQVARRNLVSRHNYLASRRNFAALPMRDCPDWVRRRHFPADGTVEWESSSFPGAARQDSLAAHNRRDLVVRQRLGARAHWGAWRHLFPG